MLEERAATWPRQWMAEGYAKGYAEGYAEGYASGFSRGLREALTELIEEKFGSVDAHYAERIVTASDEQLKGWLKRILTAKAAGDLFEP